MVNTSNLVTHLMTKNGHKRELKTVFGVISSQEKLTVKLMHVINVFYTKRKSVPKIICVLLILKEILRGDHNIMVVEAAHTKKNKTKNK